jgi:hypothetical protein
MTPALLSQLLAAAGLTGIRASWVLLALTLGALGGRFSLPPELAFLATPGGVAALLSLAILEHHLEQDEDLQDLLSLLQYALRGSGAVVVAWAFRTPALQQLPVPPWALAALAAALAMLTHHLRRRLFQQLYGFGSGLLSPRTWLLWLESGGLVGMLAALVLAPGLALVLLVLATMASLLLAHLRRVADRRLNRRPCACGYAARKEACLCPGCRQPLAVERWLGPRRGEPPRLD